jgi:uncharacterized protein YuzE
MKFHYYPETDSLYISLIGTASADSQEISPGIVLDFDGDGKLVGIDIDHASQIADLSRLDIEDLPTIGISFAQSTPAQPAQATPITTSP